MIGLKFQLRRLKRLIHLLCCSTEHHRHFLVVPHVDLSATLVIGGLLDHHFFRTWTRLLFSRIVMNIFLIIVILSNLFIIELKVINLLTTSVNELISPKLTEMKNTMDQMNSTLSTLVANLTIAESLPAKIWSESQYHEQIVESNCPALPQDSYEQLAALNVILEQTSVAISLV